MKNGEGNTLHQHDHTIFKMIESRLKVFWRYFKRNRLAIFGLIVIAVLFLIAGLAAFSHLTIQGKRTSLSN